MYNRTDSFEDYPEEWSDLLKKAMGSRHEWIRLLFLTGMLGTFVVGVAGNLLTCIVIYFDRTMHTATNYYLFNLAASDLLVSFGILLEVSGYMNEEKTIKYYMGETACKIHFSLVISLWNNGIWTMTALAIERYIAIWHPLLLNSRPVWRRVMKIIALIWMVAILETVPEISTVSFIKTSSFSICFVYPSMFARWLNGALFLINFIIPLCIMTFVYATIAFKVNLTLKSNAKDTIFNQRNNRRKVNKLVALTLSFLVCWLPFASMRLLLFSVDVRTCPWYIQNWDLLLMLSSFNGWFSIVLNPMLFSLMSTKFRNSLKSMWNGRCTKLRCVLV